MIHIMEAPKLYPALNSTTSHIESEADNEYPLMGLTPSLEGQLAKQGFRGESVFYTLFMILLGGSLTYYMLGKALEPLNKLNYQMKNTCVHNLAEDIEVPQTKDEIGEITESFNDLTHKLNASFLMQKHFSQNAAHELRTPLAVLKTKVDVFKKRKNHTPEEYDSLIEVVETHTERLSELVKNLLEMTNMEAIELNQTISLHHLLLDVVHDLDLLADEKGINLLVSGEDVNILGNYNLLHRAFYNLVENGIRYNCESGLVNLSLQDRKEKVIILIADTGIGIPDDMKGSIFEPFFRVDTSRSRENGGAGLGLSIVKSIINKHKGQIVVTNNKPCGTVFEISFNIERQHKDS
ncbi:MAG: HAMP domain-containing sensor histidine kinase [Turicibacter sp.]